MRKLVALALCVVSYLTYIHAQSTLVPQWREGEVIVRLADHANHNARSANSSSSVLDSIMTLIGAEKLEPLLPCLQAEEAAGQSRRTSHSSVSFFSSDEHRAEFDNLPQLFLLRFDTTKVFSVTEAVRLLSMSEDVAYAEPNYICRLEPVSRKNIPEDFDNQWGLKAIRMPELWQQPLVHQRRPVIAFVDTGVDVNHPDLRDNIVDGGYDFIDNTTVMTDPNGHGTHCAGIAAATADGMVCGANPDALILPIRIVDAFGLGSLDNIIQGIDYAVAHGADVISLSIGTSNSEALKEVIESALQNVVIVSSAGNENICPIECHRDLHGMGVAHKGNFPAAFPGVIGVMATNKKGDLTSWSNFDCDGSLYDSQQTGYNYELRAPGEDIYSTLPDNSYGYMSGTSMASPMMAGAISRLMQCRSYASREEMVRALVMTSGNQVDMMAAYQVAVDKLWPDTIRYETDSVTFTFVRTGEGTLQLGDGVHLALSTDSLTTVTIPDFVQGLTVTSISSRAFQGCERLQCVSLAANISSIEDEAFAGCPHLSHLYFFSAKAPKASASAFDKGANQTVTLHTKRYCLSNFTAAPFWSSFTHWQDQPLQTGNRFQATIEEPETLMMFLIYSMESGIGQIGAGDIAIDRSVGGRLVLPNKARGLDIRVIGSMAFALCDRLKEVVMPEHLVLIDSYAFIYCDSLQSLTLPQFSSYIGSMAFAGCTQLETVKLSPNVSTLNPYAFMGCSSLRTIIAPMTEPPVIHDEVFSNADPLSPAKSDPEHVNDIYQQARLLVPHGCRDRYAATPGWRLFQHIEELNEDGTDPNAVNSVTADRHPHRLQGVFSLTGQRMKGKRRPAQAGVYIMDGRKVVIY